MFKEQKVKRKIIHYKLSSLLMIIGIIVAFVCFFNGVNLYHIMITESREGNLYRYKNVINCIYDSMGEKLSLDATLTSDKGIVRLSEVHLYRDGDNTLGLTDIIMCQNEELIYPVIEGEIPDSDKDISVPTVIVGRKQLANTTYCNGKRYYTLEGTDCEVCAVIGTEGSELFDYKIILYYKGAGKDLKKAIDQNSNLSFVIESNLYDTKMILKSICDNAISNEYNVAIGGGNSSDDDIYIVDDSAKMYLIIFLFSIINIIIVSELWIKARYREIAVRKVFGYDDLKIYFLLYRDMIKIVFISVVIAVLIQVILKAVFNEYMMLYMSQLLFYILFCVVFIFAISALLLIYPFRVLKKCEMTLKFVSTYK